MMTLPAPTNKAVFKNGRQMGPVLIEKQNDKLVEIVFETLTTISECLAIKAILQYFQVVPSLKRIFEYQISI